MTAKPPLRAYARFAVIALACAGAMAFLWPRAETEEPPEDAAPTALLADLVERLTPEDPATLSGPWSLSLPDDHLAHPDAASESWVVTAHLQDAEGAPLSLLFSLARIGLAGSDTATDWALDDIWAAQASVAGATTLNEDRLRRGAGSAGSDGASRGVWVDDWTLRHEPGSQGGRFLLSARIDGVPLDLTLRPTTDPVAPTDTAADQVAARGFVMPRLDAVGAIGASGQTRALSGTAWLDRLWGVVPGPGGPLVFDRLVLHLDDGAALSILQSRRRDGRGGATLDALILGPDATVQSTDQSQIAFSASQTAGGTSEWRLTGAGLDLRLRPTSGSVSATGTAPFRHVALEASGTMAGDTANGQGSLILSLEDGT